MCNTDLWDIKWNYARPLASAAVETNCLDLLGCYAAWGGLKPMFRSCPRPPWPLKMGPIGSSETSVLNQLTPRNNPEDGRIHKAEFIAIIPNRINCVTFQQNIKVSEITSTFRDVLGRIVLSLRIWSLPVTAFLEFQQAALLFLSRISPSWKVIYIRKKYEEG